MAIEKLSEFAKDGQKNTDDLNLTDGFPVSKKPARQWFNWLFNTLTSKVNEIIDADFIPKTDIVNNLTTDDAKKPVSAKQAKNLQDNKLDKTANAVSATKLKNARKINTIDFDGMQDINIEAPLRFAGHITTLEQLNAAVVDGKYTVSELDVAGIYNYGFLVVLRSGGTCHQVYYPHLGSPINNATMAMRQTWNMNGNIASWSEWRVVGTRDDSKLPLAGGTLTGPLTMNTAEAQFHHHSSGRYLYINNGGWGVYSPQGHIPLPVSSGGTGNLEGRAPSADCLATPRNIFGQTFDGSGDVGGTITASTGMLQCDPNHYIDLGRYAVDRINFAVTGAIFNFMHASTGEIVARISPNGIDCNSASASKVINVGNSAAYEGVGANPPYGLTLANVYQNGYPTPFGNVLRLGGNGQGEILVGWPGEDGGLAPSFIRGKRDGGLADWTPWREIVFVDSLPSHNVGSATKLKTPRNIAIAGAVSGNVDFDGSGNITINTELKENTSVVRAFCSFNGTGAPVILAESNIASISVSSLKFTVTFKTPMPHADYVINGFASDVTNSNRIAAITMNPDMIPSKTVNGFDFYARYSSNASANIASPLICFSIVC